MDINRIKNLLVKRLFENITDEELQELELWLQESEDNRELESRILSDEFIQKSIGDINGELRGKKWKQLEKLTIKREKRNLRLRWIRAVAAVIVPLVVGVIVWSISREQAEIQVQTVAQIQTGSSKAIVELADGKQLLLTHDTVFHMEVNGSIVENRMDTIDFRLSDKALLANEVGVHTIRIPRGGEYVARLEDGTVVHLNSDSELQIPVNFGKGDRQVVLKGEAYFDVEHDENRKFVVRTDKADITVLGTQFDVRAYASEKEVVTTLVEGAVKVNSGTALSRLTPGFQAKVAEKGEIVTTQVNVYQYVAWKSGRMVFENETLEQIMTELQRWYDFELFYANQGVKEMRFTIDILKYDDISTVLSLMEKMGKVSFSRNGKTIILN